MPRKQLHPCSHPGCPNLIEAGKLYCPKHVSLHPEYTRSATSRGYSSKWRRLRRIYLESHPLCVLCQAKGIYKKATVVDHVIPHRGDPALFWDQNNWQALCKPCHDSKTGNEDSNPCYERVKF